MTKRRRSADESPSWTHVVLGWLIVLVVAVFSVATLIFGLAYTLDRDGAMRYVAWGCVAVMFVFAKLALRLRDHVLGRSGRLDAVSGTSNT